MTKPAKSDRSGRLLLHSFDAKHLATQWGRDTLDLCAFEAVGGVIQMQAEWASESLSQVQFNWPAVFTYHRKAAMISLSSVDGVEALAQLKPKHRVPCVGGTLRATLYVSFLEVAPWNKPIYPRRRYTGLGTLMLKIASAWSAKTGTDGAIGLHAMPDAVPFYQKLGFAQSDCPNEHHELYFELDARSAVSFRSKGGIVI